MPLAYVLDEHLRGGLWQAIQTHNAGGVHPLDVVRVGDPSDLPLGAADPDILLWAERQGRLLVSRDEGTMKTHLADHLRAGRHSPGVFLIRRNSTRAEVVSFLVAAAYASDSAEWRDLFVYIP
jgi:hypothetical protein